MYSNLPFFPQVFFVGTIGSGVATTIFTNSTMFHIRRLAVAHPHWCLDLGTLLTVKPLLIFKPRAPEYIWNDPFWAALEWFTQFAPLSFVYEAHAGKIHLRVKEFYQEPSIARWHSQVCMGLAKQDPSRAQIFALKRNTSVEELWCAWYAQPL